MVWAGSDDGGVFGPLDDATDVKEDWESAIELLDDPIELTRGDTVPDEYACCGAGKGREGSLSFTYTGR